MNEDLSLPRFTRDASSWGGLGRRACMSCLISMSIVVGATADRLFVRSFTLQPVRDASYSAGVCSALEMAAAHGALDSVSYERILRAMTTVTNFDYDAYVIRHRNLVETCARARNRHGPNTY